MHEVRLDLTGTISPSLCGFAENIGGGRAIFIGSIWICVGKNMYSINSKRITDYIRKISPALYPKAQVSVHPALRD